MIASSRTTALRLLLGFDRAEATEGLVALLARPEVAGVRLRGAALADPAACALLAATVHSADAALPPLVVVDPADGGPEAPEADALRLDLAAGGEPLEATLEVLAWARGLAELGVDLALSPVIAARAGPDLDLEAHLAAAWTEALHAAGVIACAGPWPGDASDSTASQAWRPFGAALAHGLEALRLGSADDATRTAQITTLRDDLACDAALVGSDPPVGESGDAMSARIARQARAGVDLVQVGTELACLAPEVALADLDSIVDACSANDTHDPALSSRIDALRVDWLV